MEPVGQGRAAGRRSGPARGDEPRLHRQQPPPPAPRLDRGIEDLAARMKDKPLIGVTSSRRRGRIMTALNRLALWRAGARSVHIYPGKAVPHAGLDGLVIGGGADLDTELYNQERKSSVKGTTV